MFNRVLATLAVAILMALGLSAPSQAAPSAKANQLTCFTDDSGSTCVRKGSTFTLVVEPGEWAGVYVEAQSLTGQSVKNLDLGFTYSGTTGGGAPRFSIPVTTTAGDGYAYVDTACDANGDGIVSIQEPGCIIADSFGYYGLASAYTGVVRSGYTFVISDVPGTYVLSDIKLARTPPGKVK